MSTHSFRKGRFSRAQFFWREYEWKACCTTWAPFSRAISTVRSWENESTTNTSSAQVTLSRQAGRFNSSSKVGTRTETFERTRSGRSFDKLRMSGVINLPAHAELV